MNRSLTPYNTPHFRPLFDRIGMIATGLCIMHCLTLPLLVPVLLAWGAPALADPSIERLFLLVTLAFAVVIMLRSSRIHHRRYSPLLLAATGGLCYLFKGSVGESLEPAMVALGGLMIIGAHVWNLRLCRMSCDNC